MRWPSKTYHVKADSRKIAKSILDDYPEGQYLPLGWIDLVNSDIVSIKENAIFALEVPPKNIGSACRSFTANKGWEL